MQKLFENWRIYLNEEWNPDTDYSATDSLSAPSLAAPGPDSSREIKTKPLVKVLDSFNINASGYAMIMKKYDRTPKPEAQYIEEYPTLNNIDKEYIRDIVKKLLKQRDIGIDRDNITFNP